MTQAEDKWKKGFLPRPSEHCGRYYSLESLSRDFSFPDGQGHTRKNFILFPQACGCIVGRPGSCPGEGHLTGLRCGVSSPSCAGNAVQGTRHLPSQLVNFTPSSRKGPRLPRFPHLHFSQGFTFSPEERTERTSFGVCRGSKQRSHQKTRH